MIFASQPDGQTALSDRSNDGWIRVQWALYNFQRSHGMGHPTSNFYFVKRKQKAGVRMLGRPSSALHRFSILLTPAWRGRPRSKSRFWTLNCRAAQRLFNEILPGLSIERKKTDRSHQEKGASLESSTVCENPETVERKEEETGVHHTELSTFNMEHVK